MPVTIAHKFRFTLAAASLCLALPAAAAEITGAGASFPAPVYAKWGSAWKAATSNTLNYQSIGSGGGQSQIKARTVDFGASDDPMSEADLVKSGLVQFPTVIGAVVPIVNVPGVASGQLRLTAPVLSEIYQGRITRWNDPAIVKLNPTLKLRPMPITPVYRSDSSGTTAVFTNYLSKAAPNWKLGAGKAISWPTGTGGKGNEGIAANVKNTAGALGYVESNYATANKLTMAQLQNAAGNFVAPTMASFNAAAAQADWANSKNGVVDMLALPGAGTWPIVSATYVLVERKPRNPARTASVINFYDWSWKNGGKVATELGYIPLPAAAIAKSRAEWADITGVTLR
ncbi:phosphate ABC transporter substrate-binding protein PstS [Sandaracinobacter sp. RS1-74]|uniref:phosphate ABC transporter substrate-binding protein PstS n=1 Tax=Sandaracinobacteroides sayramensis TaxID=2913411 RepID=UPI001EDC6D3A|nr:phosphate ABC transporter substrate-binding protein PstS [Sandaracinobacteroides sayramensis]MCG2841035.1 phosphate ABC transporter substrate-binding protein PstS [Sandaracinobacteroides sayramensis]